MFKWIEQRPGEAGQVCCLSTGAGKSDCLGQWRRQTVTSRTCLMTKFNPSPAIPVALMAKFILFHLIPWLN